jgi:hypothetical protein
MIERIKARTKLIRPLLIPLILYIGFLMISHNWVAENADSPWRYLISLLPMGPGIWIAIGVVRAIQQLDEMERLILLEGIAVSFMGTFIFVLSLGFLQTAGYPPVSGVIIGFFMVVLWLIAKLAIHRRYE